MDKAFNLQRDTFTDLTDLSDGEFPRKHQSFCPQSFPELRRPVACYIRLGAYMDGDVRDRFRQDLKHAGIGQNNGIR